MNQEQRRAEIEAELDQIAIADVCDFVAYGSDFANPRSARYAELEAELGQLNTQATQHGQRTPQGHLIWTSKTCPHRGRPAHESVYCHVCDGGLAVCSLCGMVEAELDQPCPGKREERPT